MRRVAIGMMMALLAGCAAQNQAGELHSAKEREMTVGLVQREIAPGMSQADVAEVLGSPNIVSRDSGGKESWIYDKIATEASYRRTNTSAGLLAGVGGMAGSVLLIGIPSVSYDESNGAQATTQRTLTVVIKYDQRNLVESATYHSSKF